MTKIVHLNVPYFVLTTFLIIGVPPIIVKPQFFNPHLNDQIYLDNLEADVKAEVEETKAGLLNEAENLKNMTQQFIGVKLTENVFKALRQMSERKFSNPPKNKPSSSRIRGRYPSKLLKQFDGGDLLEDPGPLDFIVKVTGIVFKQLLLVPHFLRETVQQTLAQGNQTLAAEKMKREKQKMQMALAIKAEPFLNTTSDSAVVGLISGLCGPNVNVDANGNDIGDHGHSESSEMQKNGDDDAVKKSVLTNQVVVETPQQLGPRDVRNLKKMVQKLDGSARDIYLGSREAYGLLQNLRTLIEFLN